MYVFIVLLLFYILTGISRSEDKATSEASLYTMYNIQNHPDVGFSRHDLIVIAILAGGDYDKVSSTPSYIPCLMLKNW